jgi:hypothetical protein
MADDADHISASVLTAKSLEDAESAVTDVIRKQLAETLRAGK